MFTLFKGKAFTLIELLIVVAIIAILAAIAVPNFLEAQTRSKVSRVLADMRSLKTAMESYNVDNNTYPGFYEDAAFHSTVAYGGTNSFPSAGFVLSTPIAYMTNARLADPFVPKEQPNKANIVIYAANKDSTQARAIGSRPAWNGEKKNSYGFSSYGPDKTDNTQVNGWPYIWTISTTPLEKWAPSYDPTNGTVSDGDILVAEPKIPYIWIHSNVNDAAWVSGAVLPANIHPFDQ